MKALRGTDDLAMFGAPPLFAEPLLVGRPNIGDRATFMRHLEGAFDRRWLSNFGPVVKEFEQRLAQYLGVRHAVTVCNATVGLEIAVRALGLSGEVIVPSFTFVATVHVLHWLGLRPVFVDIDPATHNVDVDAVRRAITSKTSGIIGVHLWGRACDTEALESIAREHDLRLMFDAAHALGCSHRGRMIGGFGECEVFSFHATKFFNTFEGGVITTNHDDVAHRLRLMSNFGFHGLDNTDCVGVNGKMNEACAAMGLANLDALDGFVKTNRANYEVYRRRMAAIPGLQCIVYDDSERWNYQYVVVELDQAAFGLPRDILYRILHAENVMVRRYFYPGCHRMEPYRSGAVGAVPELPQTEALSDRVLAFPTGTQTAPVEVDAICDLLSCTQRQAAVVAERCSGSSAC